MSELWPWLVLVGLGAFHGLNPAMGWLFAVAQGLQERRRGAVLQAFSPIALGHALSIMLVILAVGAMGALLPLAALRYLGAGVLIAFGLYKLVRRKHPRWVGMRVGFKDLTLWSFLMASAHGAGLMLVPLLLRLEPTPTHHDHSAHSDHLMQAGLGASLAPDLLAVGLHTLAMFVVMALVAIVVYDKLGLAILRRAWVNTDLIWAGALVAAGLLTLVL